MYPSPSYTHPTPVTTDPLMRLHGVDLMNDTCHRVVLHQKIFISLNNAQKIWPYVDGGTGLREVKAPYMCIM